MVDGRDRDKNRTFLSGSRKRERKAIREKNELLQHGYLNKYLNTDTCNENEYFVNDFVSENRDSYKNNSCVVNINSEINCVKSSNTCGNKDQVENHTNHEENAEKEEIEINNTVKFEDDPVSGHIL